MYGYQEDYIRLARHSSEVLWNYFISPETDWKHETGADEQSGIVHSKKIKGVGKLYRLKVSKYQKFEHNIFFSLLTIRTQESDKIVFHSKCES